VDADVTVFMGDAEPVLSATLRAIYRMRGS
jgi:hypothetical protein